MSELPSGTLTVLHTDIENSTALARYLREQYPTVLDTHRTLLRAAFTAYDGWEVDTQGDSFFVVFLRATRRWPPQCRSSVPSRLHRGRRAGLCGCVSASTPGNLFEQRKGIRGWTSSVARGSKR